MHGIPVHTTTSCGIQRQANAGSFAYIHITRKITMPCALFTYDGTVHIAVNRSARNGLVRYGGAGGAVDFRTSTRSSSLLETRAVALGIRDKQNPYKGELAAIANMLYSLTILNTAHAKRKSNTGLPEDVGRYSKRVDTALPGKHTRVLYDRITWNEASVPAQLRTGIARLNGNLYQIEAVPTDLCDCGQARETAKHFLFYCTVCHPGSAQPVLAHFHKVTSFGF